MPLLEAFSAGFLEQWVQACWAGEACNVPPSWAGGKLRLCFSDDWPVAKGSGEDRLSRGQTRKWGSLSLLVEGG